MRNLHSEHVSMVAAFLLKDGRTKEKAVEEAIALILISDQQCEIKNRQIDAEEERNHASSSQM